MKVLCISKWAKAPSPEERDAILPKEVRATLKLYLDGVIEQMHDCLNEPYEFHFKGSSRQCFKRSASRPDSVCPCPMMVLRPTT